MHFGNHYMEKKEKSRKRQEGDSDSDDDMGDEADLPFDNKNENCMLETILKLINQEMEIMAFGVKILEMIPSSNKFKKCCVCL